MVNSSNKINKYIQFILKTQLNNKIDFLDLRSRTIIVLLFI